MVVLTGLALTTATPAQTYPPHLDARTEKTTAKGLAYLARSQRPDGSWGGGAGLRQYPTAMTGLAGLALLAGGSTPTRGQHAISVRRAVHYLLKSQRSDGHLTAPGEQRSMYGHGFSTLFLSQAYGMAGDPSLQRKIRRCLVKSAELSARAQVANGGWGYEASRSSDEGSVSITQIQGLRGAYDAGIAVPADVIQKSYQYIGLCQTSDGGIGYRAGAKGQSRPAISAAALCNLYNQGRFDSPVAQKLLAYCRRILASGSGGRVFGGFYFYSHFYMSQAFYQAGEEDWNRYFPAVRDQILSRQSADGSWVGDGGVGNAYGTALAVCVLSIPAQRLPIFQR